MKSRLLFRELASKITGFTTPVFGISWEPPKNEAETAKSVVTYLEDRRVLYNPMELESPQHCISSVIEIRHFLTAKLETLDQNRELAKNLRTMRSACRKFLDATQRFDRGQHFLDGNYHSRVFGSYLGEMRGVFGFCLSQIVLAYGLDIEADSALILPANE